VGVELQPDDLLVIRRWATDVDPALATLEISGGVVWTGFLHSSGLRNSDGSVTLGSGATVIDQLDYGVDPKPTAGSSMCRLDRPEHGWASCAPNPGLLESPDDPIEPMPIPPGAVQIVEVLANPPGPATGEKPYEFIEILNTSENEVE